MTLSGRYLLHYKQYNRVLIPLLLDDPLWAKAEILYEIDSIKVLIPLLLDDPLWETTTHSDSRKCKS